MVNILLQESYWGTSNTVLLESHSGARTVADAIRLLKPWTEDGDTFEVIQEEGVPFTFVYIISGEDQSDVFARIIT